MGRISAQIAHEVRNPLSSIGLNVELLEERSRARRFAADAEAREAQRAARRGHARGRPAHRRHRAVPAHGAPAPAPRSSPRT